MLFGCAGAIRKAAVIMRKYKISRELGEVIDWLLQTCDLIEKSTKPGTRHRVELHEAVEDVRNRMAREVKPWKCGFKTHAFISIPKKKGSK